jgi:hypothetical protein
MLTVDLVAAENAGLAGLDALSWRGTGAVVGGALLAMGVGVGVWSRGQRIGQLYGVQVVALMGGLVLCSTNAWAAENPAIGTTIAVPVLAGAFLLLRGLLPWVAYGLGGLAGISWLVLLVLGLERFQEAAGLGEWWADFRGWPLLVAALFAAVVVHLPEVQDELRSVAAGLTLLPLVLLATGPDTEGAATRDLLVVCATMAALALVTAFGPRVWARGAAVLTTLGVILLGLFLIEGPWPALVALNNDGSLTQGLFAPTTLAAAAPWTAVVVALTLVAAAASLLRLVPERPRRDATHVVGTLAPAVVALGGLVLVLGLEPPLWAAVLAAGLTTAIAGGAAWWYRDETLAAVLGSCATAYLTAITLYAASGDQLLFALVTTALFLGLAATGALRELGGAQFSAGVAAALAASTGGWALISWGHVMEADTGARTLALAAYAGLVGVLAAPIARHASTRIALECAAVVLAVVATGYSSDAEITAMAMTIVGTAICLIAVTTRDRTLFGWVGAVVLGFATVIRVVEEVQAPELYTLPAAALLIAVGAWRLRTAPEASSFTMLGSGLTLALLPSLLLALDEPVSVRGALIGAAGVLVLAAGVQQRLAAPFVFGAVTTGILALRHLEPVADAVPRWVVLGGVGLTLLVVGITWEARRRNLEDARRYLTALR